MRVCAAVVIIGLVALQMAGCASTMTKSDRDLAHDPFPDAQAELRQVLQRITDDLATANVEGLCDVHLKSDKFTKFSGRTHERMDYQQTVESETAAITSVESYKSDARDVKIDVFGDVAIVTYYPHRIVTKDGEDLRYSARQTLVFLKTVEGWKIVHEHQSRRESEG